MTNHQITPKTVKINNDDHSYSTTNKTNKKHIVKNVQNSYHSYAKQISTEANKENKSVPSSTTVDASSCSYTNEGSSANSTSTDNSTSVFLNASNEHTNTSRLKSKLLQEQLKSRRLATEVLSLRKKLSCQSNKIQQIFSSDQVEHINGNCTFPWSSNTIAKSLQIRTVVGKNGYEFIRTKAGYPLPSYRSLCQHVEELRMAPGIQEDLFQLLQIKTEKLSPEDRDCCLLLDEVQLKPRIEYDNSLKTLIGYISPEFETVFNKSNNNVAEKALVFMIKGIHSSYKQPLAWFLTGKSMNCKKLWQVTNTVIKQLYKCNMLVRVVTSDMGTTNVGMWKEAGLNVNDDIKLCSIPHVCNSAISLYFMADVPHLIKSVRNCLENQVILLPEDIVAANNLPCRDVSMKHVMKIVEIQEKFEFKLVPGLSRANINPGQFGKMRVGNSTKIFSHTTASVLNDLASSGDVEKDAKSTAWFCDKFNEWFDIMSNHSYVSALYSSEISRDTLTSSITGAKLQALRDFVDLISRLDVRGPRGICAAWKPWQKGIILSTKVVLSLHEDLVVRGNYKSLLTARLTQDALENLFSQIRGCGDAHPSVTHFRQCLKLITMSQYMETPKGSSYAIDNANTNLIDFVKSRTKTRSDVHYFTKNNIELAIIEGMDVGPVEEKQLYYIAGWVVFKLMSVIKDCSNCISNMCTDNPTLPQSSLTSVKSYGGLKHPTNNLFILIQNAEHFFRNHDVTGCSIDDVVKSFVLSDQSTFGYSPSYCSQHNCTELALKKFFKLRFHIRASFITEQLTLQKQFASKSAASRTVIQ
jgi:hypothetical protein